MVAKCLEVTVGPTASLKENKASTNKIDPYAVLRLGPVERRTDSGGAPGSRPVWNHRFNFLLPDDPEEYSQELVVQIWDKVDGVDKFLGTCKVQLGQIYLRGSMDVVQPVHRKSGKLLGHMRFHFSILVEDMNADRDSPSPPPPTPLALSQRSSPFKVPVHHYNGEDYSRREAGGDLHLSQYPSAMVEGSNNRQAFEEDQRGKASALEELFQTLQKVLSPTLPTLQGLQSQRSTDSGGTALTVPSSSLSSYLEPNGHSTYDDQQRMPPPKIYQPQAHRHPHTDSHSLSLNSSYSHLSSHNSPHSDLVTSGDPPRFSHPSATERPPPLDLSMVSSYSSHSTASTPATTNNSSNLSIDEHSLCSLLSTPNGVFTPSSVPQDEAGPPHSSPTTPFFRSFSGHYRPLPPLQQHGETSKEEEHSSYSGNAYSSSTGNRNPSLGTAPTTNFVSSSQPSDRHLFPESQQEFFQNTSGTQSWDASAIASLTSAVLACAGNGGQLNISGNGMSQESIAEVLSKALSGGSNRSGENSNSRSALSQTSSWGAPPVDSNKGHWGKPKSNGFGHTEGNARKSDLKRMQTDDMINELLVAPRAVGDQIWNEPKRPRTYV